ncbi:hypothetical protein CERSUDRAFT_126714 [Gelatoporia subvermispora B]|uniref:Uncharacterized protein n=1 Tax=Ceriporiopsis subvermispora (strain B) TaxID=914234 RepID=M2Q6Z8_CERS8|nr:hypothetical protein CERSUDRAFT_126714 [Gelatoporia subvermispora B]
MGVPDKYRVYLVSYEMPLTENTGVFHWAIFMGPKDEDPRDLQKRCLLFHATNTDTGSWQYQRRETTCARTPRMVGRLLLGKIEPRSVVKADAILQDPARIRPGDDQWNCQTWAEEAIIDLAEQQILQSHSAIDVGQAFRFMQQYSLEILSNRLNTGNGVPLTIEYPKCGEIPRKFFK